MGLLWFRPGAAGGQSGGRWMVVIAAGLVTFVNFFLLCQNKCVILRPKKLQM
jgi:hypothetical protein